MKLLALDQSTKVSGYSVWDDHKLIKFGHVNSEIKENLPLVRMRKMRILINDLIDKYNPDYVILEQCQYQRNLKTYQQLSQMQGVIFSVLFEKDIGFKIIEPTAWKSFCKIKGAKRIEQKANTIQMVKDKFKIEPTEDEADAIGIGIWAINNLKEIEYVKDN